LSTKSYYLFDGLTREYTGVYGAQESPLEPGVWIAPTNSCLDAPPPAVTDQVAIRSAANDAWSVAPDYRGQTAYEQLGAATQVVTAIGSLPTGWATTPPPPTAAQALSAQVAAAFAAGQTITSSSTPALNGTYPVDAATQNKIAQVEMFIQKNGVFPGSSGTSLAWYDIAGAAHIFPSVVLFSEFATAVANYVADLDLYGAGAPGATLPSSSVTIA
jgi:hypothetical protein